MPVGPWSTFGECVAAQRKKGHSQESARAICGKIERDTNSAKHGRANLASAEIEAIVQTAEREFKVRHGG